MKRVHRMYYLKKALSPLALKLYGAALIVAALVSLVSVRDIIANMPSLASISDMYLFLSVAIMHTETTVQLALAVFILLAALSVRDAIRNTPPVKRAYATY